MFSSRPDPKTGVGMRKMTLFACCAAAKGGCTRLQPEAPARPETVYSVSTPPFGALVFTVPLALKKNGKRASRTGPPAVMKVGTEFVEPLAIPVEIAWNCGLLLGLEPP